MKLSKKGFTLLELSVVIALVAIVLTLTLTFFMYFSDRSNRIKEQNTTIENVSEIETSVKKWIRKYDNIDYRFYVEDSENGSEHLIVYDTKGTFDNKNDDTEASRLFLSRNKGLCEMPAGGSEHILISAEKIHDIKFNITQASAMSGQNIIYCDIYFADPQDPENGDCHLRYMYSTFAQNYVDEYAK